MRDRYSMAKGEGGENGARVTIINPEPYRFIVSGVTFSVNDEEFDGVDMYPVRFYQTDDGESCAEIVHGAEYDDPRVHVFGVYGRCCGLLTHIKDVSSFPEAVALTERLIGRSLGEYFAPIISSMEDAAPRRVVSFWHGSDLLAHVPLPAGNAPIDDAKAIAINSLSANDEPDAKRARELIEANKCSIRLHNGQHSVRVAYDSVRTKGHENFVTPRPLMDVGGAAPVGVDLVRVDDFVAPLSSEQMDVVRAVAGRYTVAPEAFVYETSHGHIVQLKRAEREDAVARTQRDEVEFYLGLAKGLRWVEVTDDSIEIGIAGPVMGPEYFLIEEDDAAPRP